MRASMLRCSHSPSTLNHSKADPTTNDPNLNKVNINPSRGESDDTVVGYASCL